MPIYMIIPRYSHNFLNSINCSTVICLPTIILMLSWENPLVKPMAPGSIFHYINLSSTCQFMSPFILQSLLSNLYHKNTKNIYLIISIRSHFCKWPWRDWQPLYCVCCEFFVCLCRFVGLVRSVLLDWSFLQWEKCLALGSILRCPFPVTAGAARHVLYCCHRG